MKFKFTGESESYCLELIAYGLEKKNEYLTNGQIIDVPDNNEVLINSLNASGLFEKVTQVSKPKKVKKEENE